LHDLLNFSRDLESIRLDLKNFKWDSKEIMLLERVHLKDILSKFINGKISNEEISDWADLVEARDDIGYEISYEDLIKEIIFNLANPEINYPLNSKEAKKYMEKLSD
jgi:hypothetical protein